MSPVTFISTNHPVYGATTPQAAFNIAALGAYVAPNSGVLAHGAGFNVSLDGGTTYTFSANPSAGLPAAQYCFNSLQSLVNAINSTVHLHAEISNTLSVWSTSGEQMTFSYHGGQEDIIETLGLSAANDPIV